MSRKSALNKCKLSMNAQSIFLKIHAKLSKYIWKVILWHFTHQRMHWRVVSFGTLMKSSLLTQSKTSTEEREEVRQFPAHLDLPYMTNWTNPNSFKRPKPNWAEGHWSHHAAQQRFLKTKGCPCEWNLQWISDIKLLIAKHGLRGGWDGMLHIKVTLNSCIVPNDSWHFLQGTSIGWLQFLLAVEEMYIYEFSQLADN